MYVAIGAPGDSEAAGAAPLSVSVSLHPDFDFQLEVDSEFGHHTKVKGSQKLEAWCRANLQAYLKAHLVFPLYTKFHVHTPS